jgi:triphosphatase
VAIETELKLSLSPRTAAPLPQHPLLRGAAPTRKHLRNTYYDTTDLSLKQAHIAVRHRRIGRQWLLTIKSAEPAAGGLAQRSEWETACLPGQFLFMQVDNKPLCRRLEKLQPELLPTFTTDFTRLARPPSPTPGVPIGLALDRGHIESNGHRESNCEVELELIEGKASELFELALNLQKDLALHPSIASKAERGRRVFSGEPVLPAKAIRLTLNAADTPLEAFRTAAFSCIEQVQRNEAGVISSDDPKFVHQARVAIRRLRSAMRIWKPALPAGFIAEFNPLWQMVASQLGDTRNWDALVTETPPEMYKLLHKHGPAGSFHRQAVRCGKRSRQNARTTLKSASYSALLLAYTAALLGLPDNKGTSVTEFAKHRFGKRAFRARQLANCPQENFTAAQHRLRIAHKHLRCAIEFFSALFPQEKSQDYHRAAAALQDLLGRMNDLVFAEQISHLVLAGAKGDPVRRWLLTQRELLLPKLDHSLAAFFERKLPWEHS